MQQQISQSLPRPSPSFSIIIPSPKINQIPGKVAPPRQIDLPMNSNPKELVRILKNQPPCQIPIPSELSLQQAAYLCFQQYLQHFHQNQFLNNELIEVINNRNELAQKYNHLKKEKLNEEADIIKRKRRSAHEIARLFQCPVSKCHKAYGTEGSLAHHCRLKHTEFFVNGEYQFFLTEFYRKFPEMALTDKEKQREIQKKKKKQVQIKVKIPQNKRKESSIPQKNNRAGKFPIVKIEE